MGVQNTFRTITLVAGQDLSNAVRGTGALYKVISIESGALALATSKPAGLLQQGGLTGAHVTVGFDGAQKYTAGAAVALGAKLAMADSGYLVTVASGSKVVGSALTVAVSGGVHEGLFNFATPYTAINSNDIT